MTSTVHTSGPAADIGTLIGELRSAWHDQLVLCDALEQFADGLPGRLDRDGCLRIARAIPSLLARAHRLEERTLFPVLEQRCTFIPSLGQTIEALRYEHLEDEAYAEELHDALIAHGTGLGKPSPETLGYMLRSFFENSRRHIRFDTDVLIPLFTSDEQGPAAIGEISRSAP